MSREYIPRAERLRPAQRLHHVGTVVLDVLVRMGGGMCMGPLPVDPSHPETNIETEHHHLSRQIAELEKLANGTAQSN